MSIERRIQAGLGIVAALALASGIVGLSGAPALALVLGVIALVLVLPLTRWASADLVRSIERATRRAELLGEGDLASPPAEAASADLGRLTGALAAAVESVRVAICQVRDALATIGGSSREMAASSQRYAAGSEQQAAAVGEISSTMERLSLAARQIAAGAKQATDAAADGRAAVDQTARGVAAIRDAVHVAVARGQSLRTGSQHVGDVADTISAIAERTHILALNASIEAATAGEYGRRFAVVAGQVRELAGDTRRATEQVKTTLAELREAVAALEASGEEARTVAARVDDQAQRAAAAIADVVSVVETIARATVSQHGASAELVETMRGIAEVSRESATSSRLAAESAARIRDAAARLEDAVARFRVPPSG